jgi:lipoprotein-anchoring transpeptidase ErfK/SrfK
MGCGSDADWFDGKGRLAPGVSLAKTGAAAGAKAKLAVEPRSVPAVAQRELNVARIPVPPADGPRLAPIAMRVKVHAGPSPSAPIVGFLRIGARVARSLEPVGREGCPDGWYAIRPLGFVCSGDEATVNLEHPLARAMTVEPNLEWPLPYRYGFVRAIAPNYLRVPTKEEQFKYEMRLERHLRNWKKFQEQWDQIDVGSNDVPLDGQGLGQGPIPDHAQPLGLSERYGGTGHDEVPWWLSNGRKIPNISAFRAPSQAVIASRVKRHAGIAMVGSFVTDEKVLGRRYAITTDARLIPADKIKANSGSPFHGQSLVNVGLPVAFAYDKNAALYEFDGANPRRLNALRRREFLTLNGNVRSVNKVRWVQTREGHWVKSDEIRTAAKLSSLPSFAAGKSRWIDVSLLQQTLVLYEGETPLFVTLVSTGRDGIGDPAETLSTPQGVFRVYQKHVTTTMDSDVADNEFELRDVPWVMYFKAGYALHAAYWHDEFGRARSHGCINLSPVDARYVFRWATPEVPEHWHSVTESDLFEQGTRVNIHP